MLEAAFRAGKLPWAEGYTSFAREKVRGESRLDGLLEGPGMPRLWVECKNVTMSEDDVALFPDAVSERGLKHLGTLKGIVAAGGAGSHVLLHTAARCLLLRACGHDRSGVCRGAADAVAHGVEVYPHLAVLTVEGIGLEAECLSMV